MSAHRRTLPCDAPSGKLKTLSLKFFSNLVGTLDFARAADLEAPLAAIVSKLASLDPLALFPDWSPPQDPEAKPVTLSDAAASSAEAPAANALSSGATSWVRNSVVIVCRCLGACAPLHAG